MRLLILLKIALLGFQCPLLSQVVADDNLLPKVKIGFSAGYGYRLGKGFKGVEDDYINSIRQGWDINADAIYFFSPSSGVGVKTSNFWTYGNTINNNVISNISVNYTGPIFYSRLMSNSQKSMFSSGISFGLINYKDDGWVEFQKTMIKGNTIGGLLELAYDLKIYKSLYAGVNIGMLSGVLSNMKVNNTQVNLDKDKRESMARLYGAVGFRFIR